MADLRLIEIQEDGEVIFKAGYRPLSSLEEALQRVVLCIMNTPGTMVDAPAWGGGAMGLYLQTRRPSMADTQKLAAEVIHRAQASLRLTEPPGPYRVIGLVLKSVTLKDRGYNVTVAVNFEEAASKLLSIPSARDVII